MSGIGISTILAIASLFSLRSLDEEQSDTIHNLSIPALASNHMSRSFDVASRNLACVLSLIRSRLGRHRESRLASAIYRRCRLPGGTSAQPTATKRRRQRISHRRGLRTLIEATVPDFDFGFRTATLPSGNLNLLDRGLAGAKSPAWRA